MSFNQRLITGMVFIAVAIFLTFYFYLLEKKFSEKFPAFKEFNNRFQFKGGLEISRVIGVLYFFGMGIYFLLSLF